MQSEPRKGRPGQLKTANQGAMSKVTLGGTVTNDAKTGQQILEALERKKTGWV